MVCGPATKLAAPSAEGSVPPLAVLVTVNTVSIGTAGENSDVSLRGPLPALVISVAVAVTYGWPDGKAGRSIKKGTVLPPAPMLRSRSSRNVWPGPKPLPAWAALAKNSSR